MDPSQMPTPPPDNLDLLLGHALVGGGVAWATHQAGQGLAVAFVVAVVAVIVHHLLDAPAAKAVAVVRQEFRFAT